MNQTIAAGDQLSAITFYLRALRWRRIPRVHCDKPVEYEVPGSYSEPEVIP